ncbi:MAG: transcriptional regulator NrdR [Alphaproteobacteria bacterium]
MRCPFCSVEDSQVKDSRPTEENTAIRRRRMCGSCGGRFTTFERVQLRELNVVKENAKREIFDREKLVRSMIIATRKRNVAEEAIELAANRIIRQLESSGENNINSNDIGKLVMEELLGLDKVAYIRYASVYKDFKELDDFKEFIDSGE